MGKALLKYYEVLEELKGISIEEITEAFSKRFLDSLPEVFSQKHLFERLLAQISLKCSFECLLPKSMEITELIADFHNTIQLPLLVDPEQLLLRLKAYLLSRRIVLCHYELVEALRSVLRRRDIESVKEALEGIRRSGTVGEDEYSALIEFVELRNKVLHYGYLSPIGKDMKRLRAELEEAWSIVKSVINKVGSKELEDFVECLQEPLRLQCGY
ncbi:MAG: hypothetical protein LM589_01075 [Thermosphaera sp.]|nr:hypothetical protein [Thermosphaera sp.]